MVSHEFEKRRLKEPLFSELGVPSFENEIIFVELCAGSGILSATAEQHGWKVCPIDCERNRHAPFTKVFQIDLTTDKAWSFLEHVRDTAKAVAWHMGLPCGTCSRAREIRLEETWGPRPLRNEFYPMGFPWNSQTDAKKVQQANDLYERAFQFAITILVLGHCLTIENPTRSWLWELPIIAMLYRYCFFIHLHACMFRGMRKKKTSLLTNKTEFQALSVFCDGSHEHAPWGIDENNEFNTAKEAQYPQGFCDEYYKVLEQIFPHAPTDADAQHNTEPTNQLYRPFAQPRGRKIPQLINEFAAVHTVVLEVVPPVNNKRSIMAPIKHIPVGAKLLRTEAKKGHRWEEQSVVCLWYFSLMSTVCASEQVLEPPF